MFCLENAKQLSIAVYTAGVMTPFVVFAVYRFLCWLGISIVRSISDALHRKTHPEKYQERPKPQQQPQNQPQQPRQPQPPHNPNKQHNGQHHHNQRPQGWQQSPQPQQPGPTLNA